MCAARKYGNEQILKRERERANKEGPLKKETCEKNNNDRGRMKGGEKKDPNPKRH